MAENKLSWGWLSVIGLVVLLVGLVIGGVAFSSQEIVEKIVEKPVSVEVEKLVPFENVSKIEALQVDLATAQGKLEKYGEAITEFDEDSAFKELVDKEMKRSSFKKSLFDFMNREFGLDIESKEDLSFAYSDDEKVLIMANEEDREDGNAVVQGELKVKYFENDDKSLKGKEYIDVIFTIEEDDVVDYKFVAK